MVIHVGSHYMYAVLNTNTTLLWASMFCRAHELERIKIRSTGYQFGTINFRLAMEPKYFLLRPASQVFIYLFIYLFLP